MTKANPFRTTFDYKSVPNVSCVFKLWFGKKYMIWKAKKLHQTVEHIQLEIDRQLRNGIKPGDIYENAMNYIKRARVVVFDVDVVYVSEDQHKILYEEYRLLKQAKKDEHCLNVSFDPYVPKWVPQIEVEKYEELKKPKRRAAAKKAIVKKARAKTTKNNKAVSAGRGAGKKGSVQDRKR